MLNDACYVKVLFALINSWLLMPIRCLLIYLEKKKCNSVPGSLIWRARNVMMGSILGAALCFPLGKSMPQKNSLFLIDLCFHHLMHIRVRIV